MSTLDTNVLIRYLVGDVPEQTEAARELIEGLRRTPGDSFVARLSSKLLGCWSEAITLRETRLLKCC